MKLTLEMDLKRIFLLCLGNIVALSFILPYLQARFGYEQTQMLLTIEALIITAFIVILEGKLARVERERKSKSE